MKVVLVITFTFLDNAGRAGGNAPTYEKTIEMPVSPVGVNAINVDVGWISDQANLGKVSWSDSLSTFFVEGVATAGERYRRLLADDKSWRPA